MGAAPNDPDRGHLLGGWPEPGQGPVEGEVEAWTSPDRSDEALSRWVALLQVDSDEAAAMTWGDAGVLYWLTRGGRDGGLGEVAFTWQCG